MTTLAVRKPRLTIGAALKWLKPGRFVTIPNCPACQDRFGQITFNVLLVVRSGLDVESGTSGWKLTFELEGGGNHPCGLSGQERERITQDALHRMDAMLLRQFRPPEQ